MKGELPTGLRHARRTPALLAGVMLAAAGFVNTTPASVSAYGGNTWSRTCAATHVIDPTLTVDALDAPESATPRPFDGIASITTTANAASATNIAFPPNSPAWSVSEAQVVLTVCGNQPSWPDAGTGDLGNQFEVCVDSNGAIATDFVQIGVGDRGQPLVDGPYPTSEGWKDCVIAVFGVGQVGAGPLDTQQVWQDPTGTSTDLDFANNNLAITPASWIGNQVTIYIPNVNAWTVPPSEPNSTARGVTETVLAGGTGGTNVVAQAFANVAVGLNPPVCGLPTLTSPSGCVGNLLNSGDMVNWAPGAEFGVGATAVHEFGGFDLGLTPLGAVQLAAVRPRPLEAATGLTLPSPGTWAVPACVDPPSSLGDGEQPPSSDTVSCDVFGPVTYSWDPSGPANACRNGQDPGPLFGTGVPDVGCIPQQFVGIASYGRITGHDVPLVPHPNPGQAGLHVAPVFEPSSVSI